MQRGIEIAGAGQDRVAEGRLTRETDALISQVLWSGLVPPGSRGTQKSFFEEIWTR